MSSWRTAYASVVGTSHSGTEAPCQDMGCCVVVVAHDGREVLIAAVADGAGSASHSEEGAQLVVQKFLDDIAIQATADPDLDFLDRTAVLDWLSKVRADIAIMAEQTGCSPREFACTFLATVAGPDRAVCLQIGDGAIVVGDSNMDEYCWVFWPQNGEYANSTNFIVDENFAEELEMEVIDQPLDKIAIFSDGIERLVLDMAARSVHTPALAPIFKWLATLPSESLAAGPSPALTAFLSSERVNARTDDDKTLVMAARLISPGEGCNDSHAG
jgi:Protein phosphatase 2C